MRFLVVLFALAIASAQDRSPDGATHADWSHNGGTQFSWRYNLRVFALDAAIGHLLWQYKYPTRRSGKPGGMTFVQNRGVAVSDGKVFFDTTDNFLIALDQKTGAEQ
jgi:outer membrane protein assembly factor BamB